MPASSESYEGLHLLGVDYRPIHKVYLFDSFAGQDESPLPSMYPPSGHQYVRLPPDEENGDTSAGASFESLVFEDDLFTRLRRGFLQRPLVVLGISLFFIIGVGGIVYHKSSPKPGHFRNGRYPDARTTFTEEQRPSWLDFPLPAQRSLRIRVAVITRPTDAAVRSAMRGAMFTGVRKSEVALDYRFFVGKPSGRKADATTALLLKEMERHGDVELIDDIEDRGERIAEKRYRALKWGGSVPSDSYDWFLTIDSDTFVRFTALARRTAYLASEKHLDPQTQSILIGRNSAQYTYWQHTYPDNDTSLREDIAFKGPWYGYPVGVGYMLSAYLTKLLIDANPPVPHHIHYPGDDVMIGSWVAALKHYPDKSITFEIQNGTEIPPGSAEPEPKWVKFVPKPLHPESIDTVVIDEKEESVWHDLAGERKDFEDTFSWRSVAMHHVTPANMWRVRYVNEVKDEWDDGEIE